MDRAWEPTLPASQVHSSIAEESKLPEKSLSPSSSANGEDNKCSLCHEAWNEWTCEVCGMSFCGKCRQQYHSADNPLFRTHESRMKPSRRMCLASCALHQPQSKAEVGCVECGQAFQLTTAEEKKRRGRELKNTVGSFMDEGRLELENIRNAQKRIQDMFVRVEKMLASVAADQSSSLPPLKPKNAEALVPVPLPYRSLVVGEQCGEWSRSSSSLDTRGFIESRYSDKEVCMMCFIFDHPATIISLPLNMDRGVTAFQARKLRFDFWELQPPESVLKHPASMGKWQCEVNLEWIEKRLAQRNTKDHPGFSALVSNIFPPTTVEAVRIRVIESVFLGDSTKCSNFLFNRPHFHLATPICFQGTFSDGNLIVD